MQNSINSPGFLEKQVEKLEAFRAQNPNQPITKEVPEVITKPTVIENGLKDAVKELSKNGTNPLAETIQSPESGESKEIKKDNESEDQPKEQVPSQARIDLDKTKEKSEKKEKNIQVDPDTKAHLDWLKEDEKPQGKTEEVEKPNYEEEINTYKSKVQEYESVLNDDFIKAAIEFRKSGGVDPSELSKHLGIVDPSKVTIQDFYTEEATSQGLKGEELTQAVEEAIESYSALPKLTQAKILNEFKNTLKSKTEEKLKSFSTANQGYRQEQEKIQKTFLADLDKEVSAKVGKKWKGLLIDEKMSKEIKQAAPNYAVQKFDDSGNFIGYDAEHGVEMAIYAKFGKKLLKAQYDLAKVSAYDELIEERNRPSENMTSNQIVVNAPNDIERITKEWREQKQKERAQGRK